MTHQLVSDRRDIDFVLHEMLNVTSLSKYQKYADFNRKTVDMIISEARKFAIYELLPAYQQADIQGCVFEKGKVFLPQSFERIYKLFCQGEWVAMCNSPEYGGQGMPKTVSQALLEYFTGANCAFMLYPALTHGAGKMIEIFGNNQQKNLFVKNLYTGKWTGTMLMTEPQAGSDVGAISTKAVKNSDGTYSITGTKIFISAGEHDLTPNIIHTVLARVEGAPKGSKGLSLFIVPKIWVNEDNSLGELNDVICTGIEEKMGIHASVTATLALGTKGKCKGILLGQENKGMHYMFLMLNEERLGVGMQGFAIASASYMNAVNYATSRIQGKDLRFIKDPNAQSVSIINHPDVRRQLLFMKSNVEGMRTLLYYVGFCIDMIDLSETKDEKQKYQGLVDLLIPIVKAYCTDKAFEVCTYGIHVYGGYGYIKDFPQEQLLRDCKITSIYEGTNGIQAMDLLGRKLGMNKAKPFMDLIKQMNKTIFKAKEVEELKNLAIKVEKSVQKLGEVALDIGTAARSEKVLHAFASAAPFLEVCGDVIMAWSHLWRAIVAHKALESGKIKRKDINFYKGKLITAQYFIDSVLPITLGKMESIAGLTTCVMEMPEDAFIG